MWIYLAGAAIALLGLVAVVRGLAMRGDAPEEVLGSELQRVRGRKWVVRGVGTASVGAIMFGAALCFDALGFIFGPYIEPARDLAVVERDSVPLIEAIRAYERDSGSAPDSLEALVPTYLPSPPLLVLESHPPYQPRYYYNRGSDGTWRLDVWIPVGSMDLHHNQRFQYEPDASKDRELGATLRVGDWVYVPD